MFYFNLFDKMGRNDFTALYVLSTPVFHRVTDQDADQAGGFNAFYPYFYARHVDIKYYFEVIDLTPHRQKAQDHDSV